jgi:hypothetical protein
VILPIKYALSMCEPFTDYLNITTPKDPDFFLLHQLMPILDSLGCSEVSPNLFLLPSKTGSFKISSRGKVDIYSASGGFLELLRQKGLYNDYLLQFSYFPHRISMMHVTVDYRIDAPEAIEEIYQRASSSQIYLTRKSINPLHVSKLTGKNLEGFDTGTVYLGSRTNSDVWAKVYDKRQERLAKGFDDIGPVLRVEIAVQSDIGATLRDASKPHDIFFHFASKSLVEASPKYQGWDSHGEGFEIEQKSDDLTTWQRLWGIVENSSDIDRLITLAIKDYGSDALQELTKLLRKRIQQKPT